MQYFHHFVLPFVCGAIALLGICIWKYIRWYRNFDRLQRAIVRKNMFTWKIIPTLWEIFREGLLHIRISRQNLILGYMHRSIAFGWFLLIVVGSLESHLTPLDAHPFWLAIFYRFFIHEHGLFPSSDVFTFLMDLLLLYVLSGLFLAVCKKIHSRLLGVKNTTKHVLFDHVAKASLWAIFPLRLLSEAMAANVYHNGGFLTQTLGNWLNPWFSQTFLVTSWSFYSIALCVFFVSLPFSRYMHIFTEMFLIYFRQMGVSERNKRTGFTMYELSACSRCGMCIDNCPLNRDLDIANVQPVYFLRDLRYKKGTAYVADNCLMCGRCGAACPVNVDIASIRQQERNKRQQDGGDYSYLNNLQPFNSIGRVGYFGGCMSHLTPGVTEAMKTIFETVGQKYWFMDEERTVCCGRPLMQQGYLEQAAELRRKNIELIKKSKISLLITSCPICYQSFKNEYKLSIPVLHHTEFLMQLMEMGKLKVRQDDKKTVYHDPCELGRGCGIYKEPRQILAAATMLVKAKHEKEESICCGINLGDTLLDIEKQTKIRDAALKNLLYKNPDRIATACPMCKRAFMHASTFSVKDIAEIVKENMVTK